jgi:hypothetical protein
MACAVLEYLPENRSIRDYFSGTVISIIGGIFVGILTPILLCILLGIELRDLYLYYKNP